MPVAVRSRRLGTIAVYVRRRPREVDSPNLPTYDPLCKTTRRRKHCWSNILPNRIPAAWLCALILGVLGACVGPAGAEPLPPISANPVTWNDFCHSQRGADGDAALSACCSEFGNQCIAKCGENDTGCKAQCSNASHGCVSLGIAKKGGSTVAKPIVSGKPGEAKAR